MEDNAPKSFMSLMLPIAAQNLINAVLGMLDTLLVGGLADSEHALAAVNQANAIFFVLLLFVFGIQSGAAVLISQYWGRRDTREINRILGLSWACVGAVMLVATAVIVAVPAWVLSLTTHDPITIQWGAEYARIVAPSYLLNAFVLIYVGALRCMGKPSVGMVVLSISMVVDSVLNAVMIYGLLGFPAMGIHGAAWSTLIARVLEALIVLAYIKWNKHFRLQMKVLLRPGWLMWRDFWRTATPVVLNETLWGMAFTLYSVVLGFTERAAMAVAVFAVAISIERLLLAASYGVGHAAGILVGNAIGRGEPPEAVLRLGNRLTLRALWTGLAMAAGFLILLPTVISPYLLPLFPGMDESARALTSQLLLIMAVCIPVRTLNFTLVVGILRNGGDYRAAMTIDLCSMYGLGVPLAILAGIVLKLPILWVFIVISAEECWKLCAVLWRYSKRKWMNCLTRREEEFV